MRLKGSGLEHVSKNSSLQMGSRAYDRFKLARSPAGGSLVIFTPLWRIVDGKAGDGMEVIHSLKSGSVFSGLIDSQIFSREGIQEAARWQFYTQGLGSVIQFSKLDRQLVFGYCDPENIVLDNDIL